MENLSAEQQKEIRGKIKGLAQGLTKVDHPTPILETPSDYNMEFEGVSFPSMDGTALSAWYIPAGNSDNLIICNHPMTFNRSEFPGHLEPWNQFSDVRVNFLKVHIRGNNTDTRNILGFLFSLFKKAQWCRI